MEIEEIVQKLIGDINPTGESHLDKQRLDNLVVMCSLVEDLVYEISYVRREKDRYEHSMKIMGEYADKFLKNLAKEIENNQ